MFFFGSAAGDRSFAIDAAVIFVCIIVVAIIARSLYKTAKRGLTRLQRYGNARRAERIAWR